MEGKWKVGFNLAADGNVFKSKGLSKLHELDKIIKQNESSIQILHKLGIPAASIQKKKTENGGKLENEGMNTGMKRDISVKAII